MEGMIRLKPLDWAVLRKVFGQMLINHGIQKDIWASYPISVPHCIERIAELFPPIFMQAIPMKTPSPYFAFLYCTQTTFFLHMCHFSENPRVQAV